MNISCILIWGTSLYLITILNSVRVCDVLMYFYPLRTAIRRINISKLQVLKK